MCIWQDGLDSVSTDWGAHQGDGVWEETVLVCAFIGVQWPVAPAGGQQWDQVVSRDSAVMFAACLLTLETYWSWMERRLALMILSAALIDPSVSVSPVIPLDICREPEWLQS